MRWVEFYTRGLPDDVAGDRREELLADLHDQSAEAAELGTASRRAAREILVRAIKGAPADLAWRRTQLRLASSTGPMHSDGLFAAALVGAGLMAGLGLVTALRGLHVGTGSLIAWSTATAIVAVVAGTAAAACAVIMIARRRTRFLGALWAAGAAQLLIVPGVDVLSPTSTVLAFAVSTEPALRSCAVAASVGVALFYLAIALAWMPAPRRAEAAE